MKYEDVEALVNRSTLAQGAEDYTTAETLALEALQRIDELSVSENNLKCLPLRARTIATLGNIALYRSQYPLALEYYATTLTMYEDIGNNSGVASIYCSIANVYSGISDYVKEMEYSQKSFEVYKMLDDKSGMARILGNVGVMYRNLADYDNALDYYHQSLAMYEELGEKSGMARNLGNIGGIYWNLSDNDTALVYYRKALGINEKLGNKSSIAVNLSSIGIIYANYSDESQALEYFQKALAIFEAIGRNSSIAINLSNIASLYANTNYKCYDASKAEELFLQSIALCKKIGAKQYQYTAHNYLASLYRKVLRWEDADINFQAFHTIKEEVLTEESKKQAQLLEHRRKIEEAERDRQVKLARFQEREKILDNILPSQITERLIKGEQPIADKAENVSVFFSDLVGFTTLSQKISAKELVSGLNELFVQFDILAKKHGLEKIKTIGDAYMAVCGVPVFMENHAERMATFALEIQELFKKGITIAGYNVQIRIGLHCGEVVAGVIGEQKFAYDLWGDAVNTASRMESHGEAGKIHVSEDFVRELTTNSEQLKVGKEGQLLFTTNSSLIATFPRGEMEIKGKGMMRTYYLENRSNQ